jgi:hypothetical protein
MSNYAVVKGKLDPDQIDWKFLDKETYLDIEKVYLDQTQFYESFTVDNFFNEEDLAHVQDILNKQDLTKMYYARDMNKWSQPLFMSKTVRDNALNKMKQILNNDDILFQDYFYSHHQKSSDGRVPRLPSHIDWVPGTYVVDIRIGGNIDWEFVHGLNSHKLKTNQAVVCQPEFDFHYRPIWPGKNPEDFHQSVFFHMIKKDHWILPESQIIDRDPEISAITKRLEIGPHFPVSDLFKKWRKQTGHIFKSIYLEETIKLGLPKSQIEDLPTKEDQCITRELGVRPL